MRHAAMCDACACACVPQRSTMVVLVSSSRCCLVARSAARVALVGLGVCLSSLVLLVATHTIRAEARETRRVDVGVPSPRSWHTHIDRLMDGWS